MSFRKKGFLSKTLVWQRIGTRLKHRAWFGLARTLNRIGQDIVLTQRTLDTERGYSDYRVVALLYFTRALSAVQAVLLMAERGMIVEANTITRELIETTALIAGLHKDKREFVEQLAAADKAERSAAGNWMLNTPSVTEHVEEANKEKLQAFLDRMKEEEAPLKKLVLVNVCQQANLNELYAIYRHLSHHFGHASLTAVSKFTTPDPATGDRAIFWSPEYGKHHVEECLGFMCSTFFGALLAMNEIWPLDGIQARIGDAFTEYQNLTAKIEGAQKAKPAAQT